MFFIKNKSDVGKHHTQPGQTRMVGWFHSDRELKHSNLQTSADTWLSSLSVIYDTFFLYRQPTNVSITVKQYFDYIVKTLIDWLNASYIAFFGEDCNM